MIVISIIGAIIPAWYLVNYFVKPDRFPEPEEKIRTTFIGGIKCVFGFFYVQFLFLSLLNSTKRTYLLLCMLYYKPSFVQPYLKSFFNAAF